MSKCVVICNKIVIYVIINTNYNYKKEDMANKAIKIIYENFL